MAGPVRLPASGRGVRLSAHGWLTGAAVVAPLIIGCGTVVGHWRVFSRTGYPTGLTHSCQEKRLGFCASVTAGLARAARPGVEYIYWLEDDFLHTRGVHLEAIAATLTTASVGNDLGIFLLSRFDQTSARYVGLQLQAAPS
jgi:hypothetical protein